MGMEVYLVIREVSVWENDDMSHIRNIREKIEDNPSRPVYIQTVWGLGYRFNQKMVK